MSIAFIDLAMLLAVSVNGLIQDQPLPRRSSPVTIHTPDLEHFDLALDETELDWSRAGSARRPVPAAAVLPAGVRLTKREGVRAVVEVTDVTSSNKMLEVARTLEIANPGAKAHLVLYVAGRSRSEATRRLLTREVALLLDGDQDPRDVVGDLAKGSPIAVPGVPRSYVVEADHPLDALRLAEDLRLRPGVRYAYPLLRRRLFSR